MLSTYIMCHHEVWPTSVSHPFSLNSLLCLAGGKNTRKLLSLSLDLFFKIFLFQVTFFYSFPLLQLYLFSLLWGKIMIPMYRLWLHGLYGLYGPPCPLSPERLINLITYSLTHFSPYFLLVGLLLQYLSLFWSRLSIRECVNWCRVAISNENSTLWMPSLLCCTFFIFFS